ncbi:MAG: MBL fold metallo-hydrolase [Gammaproteobacteria bacterium]|nr:MBL fold metallo-hydrolase [Gammaproteobacteria bacterium]
MRETRRDVTGFRASAVRAKVLWGVCLSAALSACATPDTQPVPGKPQHHTASGFRNLYVQPKDIGFFGFMRMKHFGDDKWESYKNRGHLVPQRATDLRRITTPGAAPQVTWIGHATVLVQYSGINVLTDPILSPRASPLSFAGPKRATQPALALSELPAVDYVLISHNHYDSLDVATVRAIGNRATWFVPPGHVSWFAEQGVHNVVELDWWQSHQLPLLEVTATPVQHWSGRSLFDRYRALWSGWALRIRDFSVWFGGDTGYNDTQFKEIGARLGPFDLGIIPIGGYEPRWFMRDMHVNPEEAVRIHREVRARYSIGVHWGTFPLTAEPIDEPPKRLAAAAAALDDSDFVAVAIGETLAIESFRK